MFERFLTPFVTVVLEGAQDRGRVWHLSGLAGAHLHARDHVEHSLINFKDTKAKFRHLKKLTCKGTLRQVFISV
jgi:hypothetical protein